MGKRAKKPETYLFPVPVVLVTCVDKAGKPNIITIAWTGVVNSEPPMVSVSIRPSRYSYKLVKETGEFVINIPTAEQAFVTDWCGVVSGRDHDKFGTGKLTAEPASVVKAPLIRECPVNLECVVRESRLLGTHEMFIAEVVKAHFDESVLDDKGRLDFEKIHPWAYCEGLYFKFTEQIGSYGFSKKAR
ncbi:MAG: flavin reductase family protein [bacterium]